MKVLVFCTNSSVYQCSSMACSKIKTSSKVSMSVQRVYLEKKKTIYGNPDEYRIYLY